MNNVCCLFRCYLLLLCFDACALVYIFMCLCKYDLLLLFQVLVSVCVFVSVYLDCLVYISRLSFSSRFLLVTGSIAAAVVPIQPWHEWLNDWVNECVCCYPTSMLLYIIDTFKLNFSSLFLCFVVVVVVFFSFFLSKPP